MYFGWRGEGIHEGIRARIILFWNRHGLDPDGIIARHHRAPEISYDKHDVNPTAVQM